MQCMREGGVDQSLLKTLMDVMGRAVIGASLSQCGEICIEHLGHDNVRNKPVMFVKSDYVGGLCCFLFQTIWSKENLFGSHSTIQRNCKPYFAVIKLDSDMR